MHLEQYDRIRARIADQGLTADTETRIALLLGAAKAVNLPFLIGSEMTFGPSVGWSGLGGTAPATGMVHQFLHTQLFRESEALTLLGRVTRWSLDPFVYAGVAQALAPLQAESARLLFGRLPASGDGGGLEALALGHALLATIRLAPILPQDAVAASPFAIALMRIEQENGRLLQTQIRLLKDGQAGVPLEDREAMIASKSALVEGVFDAFLDLLAA
jgi:hypothetical protein